MSLDAMMMVALPFAVLAVGGGVGDVAIVSAAQFLPFVVLALPAGVWADRLNRKQILIASDVTRFICQFTAGMLLVTGTAQVVHLAVLAALYGAPTPSSPRPSPGCCRALCPQSTCNQPTLCVALATPLAPSSARCWPGS